MSATSEIQGSGGGVYSPLQDVQNFSSVRTMVEMAQILENATVEKGRIISIPGIIERVSYEEVLSRVVSLTAAHLKIMHQSMNFSQKEESVKNAKLVAARLFNLRDQFEDSSLFEDLRKTFAELFCCCCPVTTSCKEAYIACWTQRDY